MASVIDQALPLGPIARFLIRDPSLGRLFATRQRTAEALQLASVELEKGRQSDLGILLSTAALHAGGRHLAGVRRLFEIAYAQATSQSTKARLSYSMANNSRAAGDNRQALSLYRRARLEDPDYQLRSYWWAELAGCLFERGRLRASEQAYRIALLLDESTIPVRGLLGDVLLRRRRFLEAEVELEAYLDTDEPVLPGLVITYFAARVLKERFGPIGRARSSKALELEQTMPTNQTDAALHLSKLLDEDPLSALGWYNLAACLRPTDRAKAAAAAVVTVTLAPWDKEAWALAVMGLPDSEYCAVALIAEAYRRLGSSLEEEIRRITPPGQDAESLVATRRDVYAASRDLFLTTSPITIRLS